MKTSKQSDKIPFSHDAINDFLAHFEGHQECGIAAQSLYTPPQSVDNKKLRHTDFCPNRARLLESMSTGGRHGFDAPYRPADCHFRWYTTPEICMILERFDGVVFIGDDMLQSIYAAFNILLRQDLATGAMKQWELEDEEKNACRCDNQIIRPQCFQRRILDSASVGGSKSGGEGLSTPYFCSRSPHFFLPISGSPAPDDLHERFTALLRADSDSYKSIPVIHTLGLSTTLSWPLATDSMDEWVSLADTSGRNVPFLWVGPNSAGHLKPPGQILGEGNNALWHYTIEMAMEARSRELDALGMYNLTLQASSWDGSGYGLRVGLVQAMMKGQEDEFGKLQHVIELVLGELHRQCRDIEQNGVSIE
ncbi:uncharacterized protein KY384_004343 [Bacidia gigantensis]|uniref:uncharacterized protein n=1 Tax=Bacidia gigantensis TaxID=2732470 RepID=UPI001D049ADD|nr:uncharacterized protein KY384_004343 [Bacidia gigantensis]KAG8530986.1 hypothetical protein KY384_004343 [Bacidia gigantensis]